MENSGNQNVSIVPIANDVIFDCERPNPLSELRSETTHPRLLGQQFESFDDGVNQSVGRIRASVLGDVGPDLLEVPLGQSGEPIRHLRLLDASRPTARLDPLGELPA